MPPSARAWKASIAAFKKDQAALRRLAEDPAFDLCDGCWALGRWGDNHPRESASESGREWYHLRNVGIDRDPRMALVDAIWDLPDDPQGNVQHVAEHGLTPLDVEYVSNNPERHDTSRSSGRPMVLGHTPSGEKIAVVYEEIDEDTVYPITAYAVED